MSVLIKTREGLRGVLSDMEATEVGRAFSEIQKVSECFVEVGLQALICQLSITHWTPC